MLRVLLSVPLALLCTVALGIPSIAVGLVDSSGRFAPNWLTAVGAAGPVAGSFAYSTAVTAYSALGASVQLAGVQLSCGAPKRVGEQIGPTSLQAVQFDIWATAIGGTGGRVVTHQGVQSLAPAGSCP